MEHHVQVRVLLTLVKTDFDRDDKRQVCPIRRWRDQAFDCVVEEISCQDFDWVREADTAVKPFIRRQKVLAYDLYLARYWHEFSQALSIYRTVEYVVGRIKVCYPDVLHVRERVVSTVTVAEHDQVDSNCCKLRKVSNQPGIDTRLGHF